MAAAKKRSFDAKVNALTRLVERGVSHDIASTNQQQRRRHCAERCPCRAAQPTCFSKAVIGNLLLGKEPPASFAGETDRATGADRATGNEVSPPSHRLFQT